MRLPDPFTHSGVDKAPGFLSAPLVDNEPIIQDILPNGKVSEVKSAAQFWSVDIIYPDLLDSEFRLINSTILKAKSVDDYIEILLPQYEHFHVQGDESTCSIASGQKGTSLVIGNVGQLTGRPYIGDLFKLDTHAKVYKIVDYTDNEDGTWTIDLYPELFITTTGAEKPVFNTVLLQMKLVDRTQLAENYNADGLIEDVGYSFRESL